ncbi:hypothetical protein PSYMP_25059 [Pseudomonas amygdali pv. morsprunorum str. M302280]|nr:hypothetical protein PSYMP_25059 [Pseudomonas amygdali pv. morsprunorum str. M302280]
MRNESGPGEQKTIKVDEWRMFDYNFALPFCVERAAAYFPDCGKTTALGNTALKTGEKCSFRTPRVGRDPGRFFACFCLVLPSLVTFLHSLFPVLLKLLSQHRGV